MATLSDTTRPMWVHNCFDDITTLQTVVIHLFQIEHVELTEGIVQQYVQLEKEIHVLEKKNVVKKFEDKTLHADELKKTVDQLEATYKELKKQT